MCILPERDLRESGRGRGVLLRHRGGGHASEEVPAHDHRLLPPLRPVCHRVVGESMGDGEIRMSCHHLTITVVNLYACATVKLSTHKYIWMTVMYI